MISNMIFEKFKALDSYLKNKYVKNKIDLILIGGAACILKYGVDRTTYDIDVIRTKENIHLNNLLNQFGIEQVDIGILNIPHGFEKRIVAINKKFRNLNLFALGPIDLILVKLGRGNPKDIYDCKQIIKNESIDIQELKKIFEDWIIDYIGNETIVRMNFREVIGE